MLPVAEGRVTYIHAVLSSVQAFKGVITTFYSGPAPYVAQTPPVQELLKSRVSSVCCGACGKSIL